MARRYHEIKGLAEFTTKMIMSSEEDRKKFLHTAGHEDLGNHSKRKRT